MESGRIPGLSFQQTLQHIVSAPLTQSKSLQNQPAVMTMNDVTCTPPTNMTPQSQYEQQLYCGSTANAIPAFYVVNENYWPYRVYSNAVHQNRESSGYPVATESNPMDIVMSPNTLSPSVGPSTKMYSYSTMSPDSQHSVHATACSPEQGVVDNVLLLLFRYHPNGVFESELCAFYAAMFGDQCERLTLSSGLVHRLCDEPAIATTVTLSRGRLYTLSVPLSRDDAVSFFGHHFSRKALWRWFPKHLLRILRLFPGGVAVDCLEPLLFSMSELSASAILGEGWWRRFVESSSLIRSVSPRDGVEVALLVEGDGPRSGEEVDRHLLGGKVVARPIGYSEVLTVVLLEIERTTDCGVDAESLERAFYERFESRLVAEAPLIEDVLSKICAVTLSAGRPRYRLLAEMRSYFESEPAAFKPMEIGGGDDGDDENDENDENGNDSNDDGDDPNDTNDTNDTNDSNDGNDSNDTNDADGGDDDIEHRGGCGDTEALSSPFAEDRASIFLGGIPLGMSSLELTRALCARWKVTVTACSPVSFRTHYGWAFLTLDSPKSARLLVAQSPLSILGRNVDVRPFLNRQRVANHPGNRPSDGEVVAALKEMAGHSKTAGVTIAEAQCRLFRAFSYRFDGPEVSHIVARNPRHVATRRAANGQRTVHSTPSLPAAVSAETVRHRICHELWPQIRANYRHSIFVADLEDEFANKFKAALCPRHFGKATAGELFEAMELDRRLRVRIIDAERPRDRSNARFGPSSHRRQRQRCGGRFGFHSRGHSARWNRSGHCTLRRKREER